MDWHFARSIQLWPIMTPHWLGPTSRIAVSTAILLLCGAVSARAQCATDSLTKGVSEACASPYRYLADPQETFWTACAVRGTGGADWDVRFFATNDGGPSCFTDQVAFSDGSDNYVDFVAGDYSTNPLSTYFAEAVLQSGPATARIEWDSGDNPNVMLVGNPRILSFSADNVIECRDILLEPNKTYRFAINALGGLQARAYLVHNPFQRFGYPRWVERDSAIAWTTGIGSVHTDSAGFYGVIVTNENGVAGAVSVQIGESLVGVGDGPQAGMPRLERVMPNPLRGHGRIEFHLPFAARVRIDVVDLSGRIVATMAETDAPVGPGRWDWDARDARGGAAAAGVYFARLVVNGRPVDRTKLLVLP
jgi:hypothetical protein